MMVFTQRFAAVALSVTLLVAAMSPGSLYAQAIATPTAKASAEAAGQLYELLSRFDSFSADYKQLILDRNGSRLQEAHGQAVLSRPNKFNWRTEEPFPQVLVSNGTTLWIYDQDLEQVTQQAVDKRIDNTPSLLLSGDLDQLQKAFRVIGPGSSGADKDNGIFRLVPNDENSMFVVLRIMFADGKPKEMQMEDNLGQQTSVIFDNVQLNPKLADGVFEFEVPPGVDLIVEQ